MLITKVEKGYLPLSVIWVTGIIEKLRPEVVLNQVSITRLPNDICLNELPPGSHFLMNPKRGF